MAKPLSVEDYITQTYPILCRGRDKNGEETLEKAINAQVDIYKLSDSSTLFCVVHCIYNTGGHGQRCKASHPDVDKVGEGILCPYSIDIPYALEKR
jgi:hypothetical protein